MEQLVFTIFSEHLNFENLVLIIQLVFIVYIIHGFILVLFHNWVEKYNALRAFRNNMILGIGSKVSVEAANQRFTGTISEVNKNNVVITNDTSSVIMDTRKFIRETIIIHDKKL